ncbi:50S ribosomal protein L10 [Candidatus Bathyarchaeota archaeon]|nr:MAG: 50S ribosomal protein L10 [Candidatus Bathyarchaeota archaeon]
MLRQALLEKAEKVEEIKKLIQQYKVLGVASLQKIRAAQLQGLRRKLEGIASFLVIKNTIVRRAIAECKDKPGLEGLEKHLTGSNIYLFTNLNPFKLVLILQKSRVKAAAKAGDIASEDVIVPAGNTGLPPGPVISQFGSVGIPTRIESGSVWINRDTLVAKKGEVITARLASVLSKLGIKPVEVGLTLKVAYDDGLIITEDQLQLDLEETQRDIREAQAFALNLSLNSAYPTPENIRLLLQMVSQESFALAMNAGVPTKDTVGELLRKANAEMLSLRSKLKDFK